MNTTHNATWIVGTNGLVFTVSRLARPTENVSARIWITRHGLVKTWPTYEAANKVAKRYNESVRRSSEASRFTKTAGSRMTSLITRRT